MLGEYVCSLIGQIVALLLPEKSLSVLQLVPLVDCLLAVKHLKSGVVHSPWSFGR
jgi:hypothetical protein